jgi:acyl-CoA thioester hydrolase
MLRTTHTSSVTEDQIDHLGHMNVMYYAVNAHAATRAVLAELPGWGERGHLIHDTYTRHHREQLLGSPLVVRSAFLGADDTTLRLHHELANADTGELAATFVHGLSPLDADGQTVPVPDESLAAARAEIIPTPDHATPRSISLEADLVAHAPSLELLQERNLAMRKERRVGADECDARGRYRVERAPMLTWGGEPFEGETDEILHETSAGVLMGWAVMENRIQVGAMPTVGDRIQSFAAGVAIHDKVTHRINWCFDLDTGNLCTAFESINMAFDIKGRRAMTIPDGYRRRDLARLQPDLAPQPVA